jgi:transglutaminase-like putative cysteine protease
VTSFLPRWPGWRHLPRDTRDTLFLLLVIAWTVLPHLLHLPPWCAVLTAGVLLWRGRVALTGGALPGRWARAGLLALAVGLTLFSFRTLLGKEPGITLAVVLMAMKTLELRARRDAFVVFFLGFFLVLTHFLYSQSLTVAAAMLLSVWGLLTALVLAHMPVGQPQLRKAARLALRSAALGAPVMVLLFVMFPRLGPLWGVPQDGLSTTGLSNSMRMGSVAELAQDDSVAMRIRFLGPVPPPEAMYFRGPVLGRYDGEEWRPLFRSEFAPPLRDALRTDGPAYRYEVTLEPLRLPLLPLLEATTEVEPLENLPVSRRDDLSWRTQRAVTERLRFTAIAHTRFQHGPLKRGDELREFVQLPTGYNPRTIAWATQLLKRPDLAQADSAALARAVLQHIAGDGFSYTLAPGVYGDTDRRATVDEFWLDRKLGFCEHFAAAFVVVMRAMDVPARVVTGYQGTDPVPVDGYHLVRQSSAHAWAEYWQEGLGWVRADPTAAVAPDRVSRSTRLAPQPGLVAGALGSMSPQLLAQLRDAWESVNNRWNQWVLNYSRGQQLDLLKNLGFSSPSWEDLALLLVGTLSTLALLGAIWAWWDRHRQDPWQRQARQLRTALQRVGLVALPHDTPRGMATAVEARFGPRGAPLAALLRTFDTQRYGRGAIARPSTPWLRAVQAQVRTLERALANAPT